LRGSRTRSGRLRHWLWGCRRRSWKRSWRSNWLGRGTWTWHRGGGGHWLGGGAGGRNRGGRRHWFRRGTGGRGRDGLWRGQGCRAYSGLLRGSDHRSGGWSICVADVGSRSGSHGHSSSQGRRSGALLSVIVPHSASLGRIAMRGLVTNALGTQRIAHSHVTAVNIVHIGVAKLTRSELGSIVVSRTSLTRPVVIHVTAHAPSVVAIATSTFSRAGARCRIVVQASGCWRDGLRRWVRSGRRSGGRHHRLWRRVGRR
jgi:hypothetical protein